jgi:hypothetical protein
MFMKSIVLYFLLLLNSCFAEISEADMQARFQRFKSEHGPVVDCANSILFLEGLKFDFLNNPDPANKVFQIEMMEKILYGGVGVGGLVSRACSPKEYTIMTEAAVLLAMWHKKQNKIDDLHARTAGCKLAVEGRHKNIVKHYETLKVINATVDEIYDGNGPKNFFKDVVSAVVQKLQTSKPSMTEDEFLRIPAMRQFDVLVANIMGSIGFMGCTGNEPNDYINLAVDDGLNALRADMHALMSAATPAAAIQHGDAIEAKLWGLSLADLETADVVKGTLIRRAFAAVERIKSVRLDGYYRFKDPRVVEDKLKDIPPAPADAAATKEKNTRLLLISMALQEYYYNPLNTLEDIQKIILAKLQQSNYWETDGLLVGKTDLDPYPYRLPAYAGGVITHALAQANTVPPVYTEFVQAIQQRAISSKSNIHFVGGNTFLHLASSGHMNQCGFFSFGLMDDLSEGGPNARQKFFEILSNSLDEQILHDSVLMAGVHHWIANRINPRIFSEYSARADVKWEKCSNLLRKLNELDLDAIEQEARDILITKKEAARRQIATNLGLSLKEGSDEDYDYTALGEEKGEQARDAMRRNSDAFQQELHEYYVRCVKDLLVTDQLARNEFSTLVRSTLAGKLLTEDRSVTTVDYNDTNLQLTIIPGYSRYIDLQLPENRVTTIDPLQSIVGALNINTQAITTNGISYGRGAGPQNNDLILDLSIDPSRVFSSRLYVLQDILVSPTAKNQLLINMTGGHYEKLISLSDPVSLVRGLRHLSWKGTAVPEIG